VKKLSGDTVPKITEKEYLIAQDFVLRGTHYYVVKASSMGEAIHLIETDSDLHPVQAENHGMMILGYTDSEDNYDS
jgi:hypothetical protein